MRLVTNPGSNLSDAAIQRYGIEISPQQVVVDGVSHDSREPIAVELVDRWVRESKEFPHIVGTTAHEFATIFSRIAKEDPEILAIMTSRKIIQSYAAASAAARTVALSPSFEHVQISIVDSRMTDAPAGLLTIVAGEAARAKIGLARTVALLEQLAERGRFVFVVETLEPLIKGGRASWLRGWLANLLNLRPIIGFVDGELRSVGRVSSKVDMGKALVEEMAFLYGSARKVWVAVVHGNVPLRARAVVAELKRALPVEYVYARCLSPSIYLHAGPGAVGIAVFPIDDLPWTPTVPPDLSD